MIDSISRAMAIDALTDENIEMNFDGVYDGEIHRTKRAAIRIIANLPVVDAVPVEWLREKMNIADDAGDLDSADLISWLIQTWQKEQEENNG